VVDYRLPDGAITNVWQTEVTISFSTDGIVTGSAGCNGYQGTWSVSGAWDEFDEGVPDPNDGQELSLDSLRTLHALARQNDPNHSLFGGLWEPGAR